MDIKRFQLDSVLENVRLNDQVAVKITCMSVNNKDIYLGTSESFILCYFHFLDHKQNDKPTVRYKYLGAKKEIVQLQTAPVLNKLLCLSDSTLFVLNLNDLEPPINPNFAKMKNILTFCLNENPLGEDPFSLELCVGKKKCVQIYIMQSDRYTILKEVNIPEQPLIIAMDGEFICMVAEKNHYMIDWHNGSSQVLLSNSSEESRELRPICKLITRGEFLIKGASHLGVFVKTSGISERPPIDWGMNVSAVAYSYPYILCLKDSTVSIFSIIDQQLKEEFCFENGVHINNFDGRIMVITSNSIHSLSKIPWEEQIESLLSNGQGQEAVDLCESLYESGFLSSRDLDYARIIKERAGLVELRKKHFDLALQFLIEADYNVCDLLFCCEDIFQLLKLSSTWIDNKDILDDLKLLFSGEHQHELFDFIVSYIDRMRANESGHFKDNQLLLNTATLLLYLQNPGSNLDQIENFMENQSFGHELIEAYLEKHEQHHILALYRSLKPETHEKAIQLWLQLEKGEVKDALYSGLCNIRSLLERCGDSSLIEKHIAILLQHDPIDSVVILTKNTSLHDSLLDPRRIVAFLADKPQALIVYLEYLIFDLQIEVPQYHTQLALIYIDMISLQKETQQEDSSVYKATRAKLMKLLKESNLYETESVLSRLSSNCMTWECALLYGKMAHHKRALEIYVLTLQDYRKALEHCAEYFDKCAGESNTNLFNVLLEVYLGLYHRDKSSAMEPLLDFLNCSKSRIDLELALKALPVDWPVPLVSRLLSKNFNSIYNREFTTSFGKAFAIGSVCRERQTKRVLLNKSVRIDQNSSCTVCHDLVHNSKFVWMPSTQSVLHDYCFYGKS